MTRKKNYSRVIATFFLLIFFPSLLPVNLLYASNNGPSAPEATGFESVNATDMVNLASGDMAYVLPVMDVGGLPITMSYHGGIPLDLESTWTGLGWNLNTGAINRGLNATPDDWNGGNSVDFIHYTDTEEIYNVNVGVGIGKAAEVGIGASWGSNKSLSGSVFASVGIAGVAQASASIDTNGNYSLGAQAGVKTAGGGMFGGGVGISGNVSGGKSTYSLGVGYRDSSGLTVGLGVALNGNGSAVSGSLGYSNGLTGAQAQAGAASLSTGSFSKGDWDIDTKGWYVPIQLGFISFGFGKQKVKSSLTRAFGKQGYGILYTNNALESDYSADSDFNDYQNRYRYMDVYDQALPVSEKEFVGDYDAEREKLNFTYAGYDNYDVNATGIAGMMSPMILQNSTLYGLGYQGEDPSSNDQGKLRVYNHNFLITNKTFGSNTSNDIEFYFNGQFTQNRTISPLTPTNNTAANLAGLLSTRAALDNTRIKQGNYVEVFTNQQIRNGQAVGLLSPIDPESNGTSLQSLNRNASQYKNEGIGGYKITAPDGKIYHFSQPVYHHEMVERKILKDATEQNISEKRQYTSYATHWLLTAITGPDFIDTNNNNIADADDYGYWVRMDFGKWSEGYVWRNPTNKELRDYDTNIQSNIGKDDFGTYQFGRKELYYLDRVVSASTTAYFVKDLRYDSLGTDLSYSFGQNIPNSGTGGTGGSNPHEDGFTYKKQAQLMLEKIVLVNNKDAIVSKGNFSDPLHLNTQGLPDYNKRYTLSFQAGGGFYHENGGQPEVLINNESGVYDVADFANFDYNKAIKVVDLEYNYNLAVKDHTNNLASPDNSKSAGSPGTFPCAKNPNAGKLCLKRVRFLGRNNYDYMPPYEFEYKGEYTGPISNYIKYPANAIVQKIASGMNGTNFQGVPKFYPINVEIPINDIRAKDEWGFLKDNTGQNDIAAGAWTMTKIKTPTGAAIDFEHEEDDFYTEAFSRRYWTDGLQFSFSNLIPFSFTNPSANINRTFDITVKKNQVETLLPEIDFRDYFAEGDPFYMDFWLCIADRDCASETDFEKVNLEEQAVIPISVTQSQMVLRLNINAYVPELDDAGDLFDHTFGINNDFFSEHPYAGSIRNACPPKQGACQGDGFYLKYKLLASKVPKADTGGGLRVKSITLKDELNNSYKTSYYYNMPSTGKHKTDANYKSSGITSYSPVRGQKFVPYQSELPSPGVMYEYVTMVAEDSNGNNTGETRYRFYTLKSVFNIFNPNITMRDDDGTEIFKASVVDHPTWEGGRRIYSKSIKVDVNTSLVGQFRTIEEFNNKGQLLAKTQKNYLSGKALKEAGINRGSVAESFQSMKSVFTADENNENLSLKNRFLSISTKEEYTSVLKSVTTTNMHGRTTETYSKTDPETGAFLVVETENAKGLRKKVERVPAYKKYPELGSKTTNPNNRHMLSQEAMVIESVNGRTTSASINTWNKEWSYRDNFGAETSPTANNEKIWRKHKNFAWKEGLHVDGSYQTQLSETNTQFNWATGTPTSNNWKKLSEITRYNHFSSPIETKDINGNFASSKMADKQNKVIVSGNARYTEMYYSGAEYVESGNMFEGEVKGANFRSADVAHTGTYSVKSNVIGDKIFEVEGSSGAKNYYANPETPYNQTFRPGKYKVSYWALKNSNTEFCRAIGTSNYGTKLSVNGVAITPSEIVSAGCWAQINYIIDIPENNPNNSVAVEITGGECGLGTIYCDDFRMAPLASSINSFVYDQKTDQLTYTLGANNMGTAYKYDNAGRLIATYAEDIDNGVNVGGFKLINQMKQNYQSIPNTVESMPAKIDNCYQVQNNLNVEITNQCIGDFNNLFRVTATGGSGNYSYQYKWLKNVANNTYTNYVSGTSNQLIPYVPKFCANIAYGKRWDFVVKVKDLNTNIETEKAYSYEGQCQYKKYSIYDSELEISKCYTSICPDEVYTYKIHLKDIGDDNGNLRYEYAYLNGSQGVNDPNLIWIDATSTNGAFCPVFSAVADATCPSGTRKIFHIAMRITNLNTGQVVIGNTTSLYYGDCGPSSMQLIENNAIDAKYQSGGVLLEKDLEGNVLKSNSIK